MTEPLDLVARNLAKHDESYRRDQISRVPILASPQEKLAALRPDLPDEPLPEFRHWVASDYPEEAARAAKRDVGNIIVTGIAIAGIGLAVVFIFVPAGAHFLRSVMAG